MDLKGLKVANSATLKLRHPVTGKELKGVELELMGRDSAEFRRMVHEDARKMQERQGKADDPESVEERSLQRTAALTVAIRGLEEDGKPISDAVRLYQEYPWVYEQAQAFILSRANFLPKA